MRRLLLVAAPLLYPVGWAHAITFTVTGAEVTASYTEPTTNVTGTPLVDLDHTNVFFEVPGSPAVRSPNVPASLPTGGGAITTTVTVPIAVNQEADVRFWATATDQSGNESPRSTEVVKRIDRLAPNAPN